MRKIIMPTLVVLFLSILSAQEARKEPAPEKKEKPQVCITLTTADLEPDLFGSAAPSAGPAPAEMGEGGDEGEGAEKSAPEKIKKKKDPQDKVNDKFQRQIAAKMREVADMARQRDVAVLEYNRLRNQFFAQSDGVYQNNVLRQQRDSAFNRIGDSEKALSKAQSELDDLQEQARKAGVPPGVIRQAAEETDKEESSSEEGSTEGNPDND